MQIFIMDDTMPQQLAELRAYAEQHPFTLAEMEARQLVDKWAPADSPDFTRTFLPATKVVFTVETTRSGRQVRHLSMSVNGRMPDPLMVIDVLPLLGFAGYLADCLIDFSEEPYAVNVLEYL